MSCTICAQTLFIGQCPHNSAWISPLDTNATEGIFKIKDLELFVAGHWDTYIIEVLDRLLYTELTGRTTGYEPTGEFE